MEREDGDVMKGGSGRSVEEEESEVVEKPANKIMRQSATGGNPFRDKPMTRDAYMKMIYEDIDWLCVNSPHTLERDHVIAVLRASINKEYPRT